MSFAGGMQSREKRPNSASNIPIWCLDPMQIFKKKAQKNSSRIPVEIKSNVKFYGVDPTGVSDQIEWKKAFMRPLWRPFKRPSITFTLKINFSSPIQILKKVYLGNLKRLRTKLAQLWCKKLLKLTGKIMKGEIAEFQAFNKSIDLFMSQKN